MLCHTGEGDDPESGLLGHGLLGVIEGTTVKKTGRRGAQASDAIGQAPLDLLHKVYDAFWLSQTSTKNKNNC